MAATALEDRVTEALRTELMKAKGMKEAEKVAPKEKKVVAPLVKAKDTEDNSFEEVFGFKPTVNTKATVYKEDYWPSNIVDFIPSVDPDYILPQEATSVLVYAIENGQFVNMVGPTGSGKSTLVEQVCAHLKRPFIRFNGRGDMETSSLLGQLVVEGGATIWKDGVFTEAVKVGATVLFDEYTATPPEINLSLQWLREHGGKLLLNDKPGDTKDRLTTPHPEFRLVCADNTRGLGDNGDQFAGTNIQNSASLNRFDITIEHNYMEPKKEAGIITKKYPELSKGADYMVKLATLVRNGYGKGEISVTLSPRNLLSWAKKAKDWGDMEQSFVFTYYNMLPSDSERSAVQGFYKTVFDKALKV